MTVVWEEVKRRISSVLPKNSYALWIDPITVLQKKDHTLVLGCPNKFSRNWVAENYRELIERNLQDVEGGPLEMIFEIQPSEKEAAPGPDLSGHRQLTLPHMPMNTRNGALSFNDAFTFDRFIVGRSNEFAYSASKAFALGTDLNYQALLMLANTGLGKTHLSHAIGHAILQERPRCRVYYTTAEQFTNEMIASLKNNSIEAFKEKYRRGCDVLLLDEVHFLGGKQKTQAELGYTLDALTHEKKQIIFTSSLAPKDVPRLSKELSSRFTSGLVATIERPDYETRIMILRRKAAECSMTLSKEILHFLASRLTRDVRQLECALNYLRAKSDLLKARVDLSMAKDVVQCLVSDDACITPEDVRRLICKYYKIESEVLRSKSRKKAHTYPRNVYAYLCRKYTDEALEAIAKTINRSHSTVLYASELMERKIRIDPKVKRQVDFLGERLEGLQK
jgi:chromosomal replication initiator protein